MAGVCGGTGGRGEGGGREQETEGTGGCRLQPRRRREKGKRGLGEAWTAGVVAGLKREEEGGSGEGGEEKRGRAMGRGQGGRLGEAGSRSINSTIFCYGGGM